VGGGVRDRVPDSDICQRDDLDLDLLDDDRKGWHADAQHHRYRRYVRMYGTARAAPHGYSLWEFGVYAAGAGGSTTPTPTPTSTSPTGTGEPPASFWGNTSAIPAATHVLEVAIVNQTNGQYPDSQVYWSFNGQEESIAQQPYIDMPANSANRMYFYLGSPNSQFYAFIEFTVGASSINVDTTRVDRFGLKLALLLHGHDGSSQEVGENYATFTESRTASLHHASRRA
jgi:hypothetical protein